jgi:hypothetical protein
VHSIGCTQYLKLSYAWLLICPQQGNLEEVISSSDSAELNCGALCQAMVPDTVLC